MNKSITTSQCIEVLLWIKVISDYSDAVFEQDDFSSKMANFLENYSEQAMEMDIDTFLIGLNKMVSLSLLKYNEENRTYEITKECEDVINSLAKAEILTDKTFNAIKSGVLKVGKFVKENIDKIQITLINIEIQL